MRNAPTAASSGRPAVLASAAPASSARGTLIDALERGAALGAPLMTLHGSGGPRRFAAREALGCARRWASSLAERGVRQGDPVAILLPTSTDFVGALLGTMLLGAIPLPLAAPMTFGPIDRYLDHLGRVTSHARATALVTSARVASALASLPLRQDLRAVLIPTDAEDGPERARGPTTLDAGMPALLQYTSGTTGRPKGVVISHRALMANTSAIAHGLGLTSHDVGVSWLPMYHDMGLVGVLLTAITHPYELHVMSPEAFVMRPGRWLELVSEHRATISTAPNFAYEHTTKRAVAEGLDLSSWRAALSGAEPVQAATLARFHARFGPAGLSATALTPVYGLAEATLAVAFHPRGAPVDVVSVDRDALEGRGEIVLGSGPTARELVGCGVPVQGTAVAITDDRGRIRQEEEVGEIRVSGPGLMEGYHRDERATADALVGGWLRTGDLGFVRGGRLFVAGRARELIIQAGRNVHPEDVEEVAREVDACIGAAAAFARPNDATGTDDLVLVLETRGLTPEQRDSLGDRVRGEILACIGVRTNAVAFWPTGSIPRTSSGKVRRRECALLHQRNGRAA